jgi:PAS domain S-box-containing protein
MDVVSSTEGPVLLVQDDGHLVNAHFEADSTKDNLRRLRPGSIVKVTGVCTIQVDQDRQPLAMRLHVASPEDVLVVAAAPWWRSAYTARVVYTCGLAGLVCGAWVMLLRRQVRQQARTIREKLERELALERRARTLTEHSVVGIWQVAPDGRTVYVNPAMRRLLELDEETEFLGRDADSFLPGLVALSRDGVAGYAVDTTVVERESEMMTMTGRRRAVLASVAPVVDPEGRLESWIGTAVDITKQKDVERELAEARDMALESARLKSEFLANMSHEIRTPMNGVIGMIDLLLGTPLNRDQKDFARTVRDSAELLMTLINDILDFSKIEAGRLELDEVDFELQEVVESSIQLLSHRALEQGLGFGSLVGHDVPRIVRGDPTRLRQILLNLLNNAIKFTERGEVFLEVAREMPAEDGIRLRFEVHDTGIGISSEVRSHLFQAFVQADGSTTRKYGGTGLGLAISRQLVRLFRGEIGVESEPGRGSIFWFTVRLGKAAGPFLDPALSPECFVGKRALVVDDNAINRRIVRHHLGAWGIASDEEARPEAALDRLVNLTEETRYDVAIVDMQMPGMDGLMLAERIRAIPAQGGIPILLLTSMGQDLDRAALRALGIRECLSKPFRQEELRKSLTRVLRGDDTALRSADKAAEASSPSSPSSAEPRPAGRSALRILIAEDNAVNQKVAIRQLEALGYKADMVADGVEAVAAFRRSTYDVILMDCQMPRMDGYEATARIRGLEKARATPGLPPVKIIAMTAHAMRGDREKCLAAGMDQYLSKPLVMVGLRKALELATAGSDPAVPASTDQPDEDTQDVLSVQALEQIRELGSEDLLKEIVDLYLSESPPLVARMREAWQSGDRGALEMLAHTLKGSSRHVGANRLAAVLSDVELRSQKGTAISDEGQLAAIEAAFERARNALRDVCCRGANQGSAAPDGLPQTTQSGL